MSIELNTTHLQTTLLESNIKNHNENLIAQKVNGLLVPSLLNRAQTNAVLAESEYKDLANIEITLNFAYGSYNGCHQNGIPCGFGVMTFNELDLDKRKVFKGNHKDGKAYGSGLLIWLNGLTYQGGFKDGEITGKGIIRWPDGTEYEGTFTNRKKEGNFKYDEITGTGAMKWPNGTSCRGTFVNGKVTNRIASYRLDEASVPVEKIINYLEPGIGKNPLVMSVFISKMFGHE
jgi:hypothetical protein